MDSQYRLIDADTHVNEPPDLWTSRVPAKFRDRAPRQQRFDDGDAWVLDGVADPITFGLNATAGMRPDETKQWVRWEDLRAGGYDPAARLVEMDEDRIDAAILYPTPRLSQAVITTKEPDFHLVQVQAYNDWLLEYCSHAPGRLGALPLLPNRGTEMALRELERIGDHPATKGVLIGCWPNGTLELTADDEKVLQAVSERDLAGHIHVQLMDEPPAGLKSKLPGDVRWYDAPKRILQLIWSGVFDRVPSLRIVLGEVDIGWMPYFKEQVDERFLRLGKGAGLDLARLPSEYIEEHFYLTYIIDSFGLRNRDAVGVERILWSSDYPHIGADWPTSWRRHQADFSGVSREEKHLILAGNAQRLYRFGP